MPGRVFNRFKILLAEKQTRENRKISYEEIKDATGIAASTLSAWATNTIKRYDAKSIASLCDYLGCELKELIVYEPG